MKYGARFERRDEILRREIRLREIRRRETRRREIRRRENTVENGSGAAIELRPVFKVFVLTFRTWACSTILNTLTSEITTGIGNLAVQTGDHPAWDVIITKLDSHCQMKIAQLNQRLADVVKNHAEYELGSFQRRIRDEKYM